MPSSPFDVTYSSIQAASSSRHRARLYLTASVLALALAVLPAPTLAQQTGGNASNGSGAGGTTNSTDGTATNGSYGGGGGAGVIGGNGGESSSGGAGGAGGAAAMGGIGGDGGNGAGGSSVASGGGGGAHGFVGATFPVGGVVRGGAGGKGGSSGLSEHGGGGGGGGYGAFFTGVIFETALTATITGGNGGAGGAGGGSSGSGGGGGVGGVGVFVASPGASVINSGKIIGGNGGAGGTGGGAAPGIPGAGGAGIVGAGLSIDNRGGTISGGLSGNGVLADAITFTGGANTLTLSGTGGLTGNIGITGANSKVTFNQNSDVVLSNVITGAGGIIQNGSGKLTLTGASTYAGSTTITNGVLQIGDGGTTGAIIGNVINDGTLAFYRSDTVTFGGLISGSGAVTQAGTGATRLTGANTYSGLTTISAGALLIDNASALGSTAAGTIVASGAALHIQGGIIVGAEALTLNGTGVNNNGALRSTSGLNRYGGAITLGTASRISTDAGELTLTGAITGANTNLTLGGSGGVAINGVIGLGTGGLTKDGNGVSTLKGANTYAGTTTISAGALNIQNAAALGSTVGGTIVEAGAALQIQGSIAVGAEALTLNGTGIANTGALRNISGGNTFGGTITLGSSSLIVSELNSSLVLDVVTGTNKDLTFNGGGTILVGGITTGSGSVTKEGAGILYLSGMSNYSGATTINGGRVHITGINSIGRTSAVTVNASGSLSVSDLVTIGSLAGGGRVDIVYGLTLTTGKDDTSTTFSGVIAGGSVGLTKIGAGTLTLSGANTFDGTTTVNGGELRVNGSLASAVTVQTGATLSGIGTITNAVTVQSGGTLSAGQSPGTLTVGSLTLDAGSTTVFELGTAGTVGGMTNDLVNVTGNLTLGGVLNVNAPSAGYYRLFNYDTLTSGAVFSCVTGITQGAARVLTNIDHQVNLLITMNGQTVQFWDGTDMTGNGIVNGGSGTWSGTNTNWTGAPGAAAINDAWETSVGVFAGAAGGTVTVEGMRGFDTLQFSTDGYVLQAGTNGQLALVSSSGAGTVNVDGGVTATINTQIVDGNANGLTKVGTGTLVLAGPNLYTGTTTISAGALNIQHATALGTMAGGTTVASGAALQMQGDITVGTEALTLNGMGVANDGALRSISGHNNFNGAITLGSASRINSDAGTLTLYGTIANDHGVTFGGAGRVMVRGAITGTGGVTMDGTNTVALNGANTYTGTTMVDNGLLQIFDGAAIIDTGAVVVNAPGSLEVIHSETIGSLAGGGTVSIWTNQTLTIGRANTSTTFSGEISQIIGAASLTKIGTGTLTLTGNSTYRGATTVEGGTLQVDGSLSTASLVTVRSGGTLTGSGTVGSTVIDGGTLSAGGATGVLAIQGNLSLTAASSYMVEVSPASASRINVTGTADLGGATVNANFATGSYVEKQYIIVNATGGVNGTFGSQVNTNLPSNFKSQLRHDANNAYLDLALSFDPPTPPPGPNPPGPTPPSYASLNGNQSNVGNALVGFFNRTGGIPLVFGALDAKGLSQVAGELGTGGQQTTFNAMTMFMGVMTDPFAAGRGEVAPGAASYADATMAYAGNRAPTDAFASLTKAPPLMPVPQELWNLWASGFGGSQTTDGNAVAGSNNSKSSIYGMAAGADYWFSPFTVAGVSMAGGGTNFSVNGGGSGRSDLFQVGGFVRHAIGSTYISAAAAYGWQDITTDRTVTVAGLDQFRAQFNAHSYSGRAEIGNRFMTPWIGGLGLTPYGAAQVTAFDLPAYAERVVAGANTFALAYSGKTITATRTELGFRTDKSFALNDAILTLRGRAAWAHDFNTDRSASATFQTLPGASFVVNGAALARNAALTTASAELKWMNGWSVAGTFEGEFSDVTKSYAGKGVVRYAW